MTGSENFLGKDAIEEYSKLIREVETARKETGRVSADLSSRAVKCALSFIKKEALMLENRVAQLTDQGDDFLAFSIWAQKLVLDETVAGFEYRYDLSMLKSFAIYRANAFKSAGDKCQEDFWRTVDVASSYNLFGRDN